MSSDFDPYYLWLGIPPHEQPPQHYRLLGIALFESNPSVIDSAASRQSTYLHSVATGPQRQASQKLLTEIAAARRTLLNAETKTAYDAELRSRLDSTAAKPVALPIARPVVAPTATPVAVPVAVHVAAPVAQPVTTPVAAPIAVPIAAPVAESDVPDKSEPLANLFDFSEEPPTDSVATPPPPVTVSAPSPEPAVAVVPKSAGFANRRMWLIAGGASVLVVGLVFAFLPRGSAEKGSVRSKKATAKKSSSSEPAKKSKGAATAESDPDPQPSVSNDPPATGDRRLIRYIRIELPRKGILTLAEVEAFHMDGRNVAGYGFAEQKNTANGCVAARAIDGNPSSNAADASQSLTQETDNPWWQVDLGGAYPLEKIVIHNRTDAGMSEKLAGFTLLLFDKNRRPLAELKDQPAPAPKSEFVVNALPSPAPVSAKAKPSKR